VEGDHLVTREALDGRDFVQNYIAAFQEIKCDIEQAVPTLHSPSEIGAKILNALLFLEFLTPFTTSRCRVLHQAWNLYTSLDHATDDSFWTMILVPLLGMVSFGNPGHIAACSPDVQQLLDEMHVRAPALLDETEFYDLHSWLSDGTMRSVLDHLSMFDFAINNETNENSPGSITPGMLDDAHEALARILQGKDKMASRGIFYTSPAEIELICKTSLLEYLYSETGISRRCLCEELLDPEIKEPGHAGNPKRPPALTKLQASLEKIRVLDPACGSGAFLIGICNACHLIVKHAMVQKDVSIDVQSFFEEFITRRLRGVDTDAQAVQLARMKLWLWLLGNLEINTDSSSMIVLPDLSGNIIVEDFMQWRDTSDGKFHVIIGNPPYIRQEDIKPPSDIDQAATRVEKSAYKETIIDALKTGVPPVEKINKMSDFYVYFFFKGVQLLHGGGILCFITSNSWLDANFGKELQRYLLKHTSIITVTDFAARSFDIADINTTITLCRRLKDDGSTNVSRRVKEDQATKFIHFKQPPSEVKIMEMASLIDGEAINQTALQLLSIPGNYSDDPAFRLFSINQEDLSHEDSGENSPRKPAREKNDLVGNKWRVQYLNSSELFYTILKKGQGLFVSLNSLATIKAGCYSGINDFFYLTDETIRDYGIEPKFYRPLLRNSEDISSLAIGNSNILEHHVLVVPPLSKSRLLEQGFDGVVSYIEWGESQKTTRGQKTRAGVSWPLVESVRSRPFWYSLAEKNLEPANQFMQYIAHDRFFCPWSTLPVASDRSFHRIFPRAGIDARALHAVLNSTVQTFLVMNTGRSSLGGGALKIEATDAKEILAVDIRKLNQLTTNNLTDAIAIMDKYEPRSFFIESGLDPSLPFKNQQPHPVADRLVLDTIMFDLLGLDNGERDVIYRVTCDAINTRLKKARTKKKLSNLP